MKQQKYISQYSNFCALKQNIFKKFTSWLNRSFFPISTLLMRFIFNSGLNLILSGLLISNASFIGVLYFGYKLAEKWFNTASAHQFLLILLLFLTSIYFGAVYTESLFLLLILAVSWYYEQQKNTISGLLTGLFSGVRPARLLMLPAIFLEWLC